MPGSTISVDLLDRSYNDIVDSAGTDQFGAVVKDVAKTFGVYDVFGFIMKGQERPNPLFATSAHRADIYSRKFHGLDPMIRHLRKVPVAETVLACRIKAREIRDSEYRNECFEKADVSEKLCYVRHGIGRWNVMNFYRHRDDLDPDLGAWSSFAKIIMPLMGKHAAMMMYTIHLSPIARIEGLLQAHFPGLTDREMAVCARTMIGVTAQNIGDELGISKSSVLTYRRRAYLRLDISSASQLIARFDL